MKNFGKKLSYIDSNFFTENVVDVNSTSPGNDNLRSFTGFLWTKENNKFVVSNTKLEPYMKIVDINDDTITVEANKKNFFDERVNEQGLLELNFSKDLWKEFLNFSVSSIFEKNFEDYYFEVPEVVEVKDGNENQAPGINYSKKEFIYNFYSKNYENLVSDPVFNVKTAPSYVSIASDPSIGTRSFEENLNLSLGGLVNSNYVDGFSFSNKIDERVESYFNKFTEIYSLKEAGEVKNSLNILFTNVILDKNKLNFLRSTSFVPFPFYCDFSFTNIINSKQDFSVGIQNIGKVKKDLFEFIIKGALNSRNFIFEENFENVKFNQFDLKKFIEEGVKGVASDVSTLELQTPNRVNSTYSAVEYANLIEFIKKTIKNKKRSYKDMVSKPCETELLFYKIEKRESNFDKAPVLQNFFVDADDKEIIRVIDTQIKYGIKYFYTIKAYILVIGNSYSYSPYEYDKDNLTYKKDMEEGRFRVKYKNNATYKIFEVPYGKFSGACYEKPYTKPQVKILQKENFINFSLLDSENESLEEFEFITSNDFTVLQNIKESQENKNENHIHSKKNNQLNTVLEIYKTTEKPLNYLSFQGKLYKKLFLKNNAAFDDTIIPNMKHYYTFRYLNIHGVPSNLSKVYEVEMREEEGYKYLILQEIDLNETAKKVYNKSLKKYLLIRPSMLQTFINIPENPKSIKDIHLGPEKQSVWNKNFILRITSKKTNRVLEFDLKSIINYDE